MNTPSAFDRRGLLGGGPVRAAAALGGSPTLAPVTDDSARELRTMPRTPGVFRLRMRACAEPVPKDLTYGSKFTTVAWNASETAIIICDMWSDQPCELTAHRVDVIAPRVNDTVTKARDHGAFIVHAPSGGAEKYYSDTPYRARMKEALFVNSPVPIISNGECDPDRETELPVEANRLGEDLCIGCDDPMPVPHPDFDRHEHPAIKIIGWDGVSQSGQEMWNVFQREGIRNVVLMGVATNVCVLGRPFGIRMMVKLGFNVALCRDLTDALYDPRDKPFVSHARGVELIVEHIEKYWCPSILSEDLMSVAPGSNNPAS